MRRIGQHLTYANVMATLAVFIALGGTALGAVIITSNGQVAKDTISGHHPPSGDHPNIISGSVAGKDLSSGIHATCPAGMIRVAPKADLCIDSTDRAIGQTWSQAASTCADAGLRLPSVAETLQAEPILDTTGHSYWTDAIWDDTSDSGTQQWAWWYDGPGNALTKDNRTSDTFHVRCVATPVFR
jgi:hypothetical protein